MIKKENQKIRIDLFRLHDSNDNTNNWIFAKGQNLESELKKLISQTGFSNTSLVKHLMKKLKISIASAERLVYLKKDGNWYPLAFIEELVDLTNSPRFDVQDKVEFLKSSSPPVVEYRAIKELTINLCKIVGAHAADGTLRDAYIAITDRHKNTILSLIKLFEDFGYTPKISRIGENEYGIRFHSRIISRYLTKIFGFPSGCKQYTVKEPELIKNAPIEFRKAFALGVLTFEAGFGITNKIELCVVSKPFRDSISDILTNLNIKHISMDRASSTYWRLWSGKLTKEEAIKWIDLFEPYSEKWFKLSDYINGYSQRVSSFEEALQILDLIYPTQSSTKITLKDVFTLIKELKQTYRYELVDCLINKNKIKSYGGKWAHSVMPYLDILKRANIILIEKRRFGPKKSFGTIVRDVYIFNENIDEWRLPNRSIVFSQKAH